MTTTPTYFQQECYRFFQMCSDERFSLDELNCALRGLALCLFNIQAEVGSRDFVEAQHQFDMVLENHLRRLALRLGTRSPGRIPPQGIA